MTPSNSARLVPSEIGGRLDASNQASEVRLLKCTTRGKREGEGERYRQRTTALVKNNGLSPKNEHPQNHHGRPSQATMAQLSFI